MQDDRLDVERDAGLDGADTADAAAEPDDEPLRLVGRVRASGRRGNPRRDAARPRSVGQPAAAPEADQRSGDAGAPPAAQGLAATDWQLGRVSCAVCGVTATVVKHPDVELVVCSCGAVCQTTHGAG